MKSRMYREFKFTVFLLILIVPHESNASLIGMFRKLAEGGNPRQGTAQVAPAMSPVPNDKINSAAHDSGKGSQASGNSPKDGQPASITNERCDMPSDRCSVDRNIAACLSYSGNGPQLSFIIQNDGESSLKVNITILPGNATYKEMELPNHQAKKINISSNARGIQSVALNAGNGECVIHVGSLAPENNFYNNFQYAAYITPIHGVFLLFITVLIIGGIWACCKMGTGGRHLDGVPYQELEMGQPQSLAAMETDEGWDQGWDDDWDEEKAVRSPGGNRMRNGQANDFNSISCNNSNGDGWRKGWDD